MFQSINATLAKAVDYMRFRAMISKAPYFQRQLPVRRSRESEMRFPNRIIVKPVSGTDTAAIGQNVIGGIIDEVNYMAVVENSKASRDGSVYDQAVENYNTIARRRESRFMVKGALPGMLCLVSSRNYPGQFTDIVEKEARTNPRIYVYDKRLWELRPDKFIGPRFRVFVGDESRKPRIMEDGDTVPIADEHLVVAVPIEYKQAFESNIQKALRDIAGVATQAMFPFMVNTEAVARCFGSVQSIASREDCDFRETRVILYPKRAASISEFARLDAPRHKLDEISTTIGEMRGDAELADQYDFLTSDIDRYHHDDLASDHHVALLHDPTVLTLQGHVVAMIIAVSFGKHLRARQNNVRRQICKLSPFRHQFLLRHYALGGGFQLKGSGK